MRGTWLVLAALAAGGCAGEMILTAPDVVALPGGPAPVVMRLQRREFWRYCPACEKAPITLRLKDGSVRCARTDRAGYAAVAIPAPSQVGRHEFELHHQDSLGDTIAARAAVYVLAPDKPIAIVDLDSLPTGGGEAAQAADAIRRVQGTAQVIYATGRYAARPARAHRLLKALGLPDGAVLAVVSPRRWYKRNPWRKAKAGPVAELRKRLPGLKWGITAEDDEAEAFLRAGLTVLAVGRFAVREPPPPGASVQRFGLWARLNLPEPPGPR